MTTIEFNKATIITDRGPDYIYLSTDLGEACWPYDGKLSLLFTASAGDGKKYCKATFGLTDDQIEII